ncbi:uncharacterized GPI-anchored protein At4g28100 [Salvia hispanica]|uniref:uncharacterized GPI-anchored protein At4g28100 n=1 Tax=Salvia hispanica TaxID=49212 RepID=UPI002009AF62|nr:uncharacterized GPI-anchored protein At4g28100 [Salvia hispanica]
MFQSITFSLTFLLFITPLPALPILPDPDPAAVQTQTLHRPPPATIPAFPEQSDASACPLDLPDQLFRDIKSACGPNSYSGQLHRSRCCPVLAAWLYSAYSDTALRPSAAAKSPPAYEMPVLPEDSETCVDSLEKALGGRGIQLRRPNDTCDVVYCYCGIRLHPFTCSEAFRLNSRGKLVGGEAVENLERDCAAGRGGCSKCLNSLYLLNGERGGRSNRTERTNKMHNQDCQLMGITWLLNKDRSAYIHTVSAVLRALMMNTDDASDPTFCSLNSDGMPLAVDSSEINDQSSSTFLKVSLHKYLVPLCLLYMSILWFVI